jgi:hypothetical protein
LPRVKELVGRVPGARFVPLPGVDHWAGAYRGDLVLPHVRSFLAEVARPAEAG